MAGILYIVQSRRSFAIVQSKNSIPETIKAPYKNYDNLYAGFVKRGSLRATYLSSENRNTYVIELDLWKMFKIAELVCFFKSEI